MVGCVVVDAVVVDEDVENRANFWVMVGDLVRSAMRLDDDDIGNGIKAVAERIPPDRRTEVKRPVMAK